MHPNSGYCNMTFQMRKKYLPVWVHWTFLITSHTGTQLDDQSAGVWKNKDMDGNNIRALVRSTIIKTNIKKYVIQRHTLK